MADLVCLSPVDGKEYARRSETSAQAAEEALGRVRRAQLEWKAAPLGERCEAVRRFMAAMERLNAEIVPELAWQMGRPVRYGGELRSLKERVEAMIALAPEALSDDVREHGRVVRVPAGLAMVIAPWNYPFLTAANTIVPALLAGNGVILKHSAQTLLAGERIAEAFAAAGLPDGLFANLFLGHEATEELLAAGLVDHATFTGSVDGGRAVERAAAGSFTTLTLELGGKDPAYVRADADVAAAVEGIADGAFYNSGQSCCGVERVYVHDTVWEPFLEGMAAAARAYRLGDPLDPETSLGPMATAGGAALVRRQVAEALRAGAKAHVEAGEREGRYVAPQVLTQVTHSLAVMRDETFGPVVGLMKVADDEQALQLMNDSRYGLTASIWTRDLEAGERLAMRVEAGTVLVNRCDYLDPFLAWTGVKDSGRGASLGRYGFDAVTRPRSLHRRSA